MGLITAGARRGAKKTCPHTHTKKALCAWPRLESRPRATHREKKSQRLPHEVLHPPRPSPLFYSLDSCASCTYLCLEDLERPPQSNLLLFTPVQAQYQARTRQYHPPTGLTRLRGSYSHRTVAGTRPKRTGQRQVQPECQPLLHPEDSAPRGSLCNRLC